MFIMFGIGIINFFVFDVLDFDLVSFGKNAPLFFYAGLSLMVGVPFNIWLWNRTIKGAVRDFTWQNKWNPVFLEELLKKHRGGRKLSHYEKLYFDNALLWEGGGEAVQKLQNITACGVETAQRIIEKIHNGEKLTHEEKSFYDKCWLSNPPNFIF